MALLIGAVGVEISIDHVKWKLSTVMFEDSNVLIAVNEV